MTCVVCGCVTKKVVRTRRNSEGIWRDEVLCPDCIGIMHRMDEDDNLHEMWSFQRDSGMKTLQM